MAAERFELKPFHVLGCVAVLSIVPVLMDPPGIGWLIVIAGCGFGAWRTWERKTLWSEDIHDLLMRLNLANPSAAFDHQGASALGQPGDEDGAEQMGVSGSSVVPIMPFGPLTTLELFATAGRVAITNWPVLLGFPLLVVVGFLAPVMALGHVLGEVMMSSASLVSAGGGMVFALVMALGFVALMFAVALPVDALLVASSVLATESLVKGKSVTVVDVLRGSRKLLWPLCRLWVVLYAVLALDVIFFSVLGAYHELRVRHEALGPALQAEWETNTSPQRC